jgi:hypothetical protein
MLTGTTSIDTTVTTLALPRQDKTVSRTRVSRRMKKRVLLAVLVFAAPVFAVSAQDAKVSVDMMGIGGMSCAHWRSTQEHRLEGAVWIYGFWTGLNYVAAASDQTQAKIDESAIVPEVEKTCALKTSQTLASAVWTTYLEFNR